MSTFDEHVAAHTADDGTSDLDAAVQSRAAELAETDADALALKAARQERTRWEAGNRERLGAAFKQPTLDGLDVDVMVPLGENVVVRMGSVNVERARTRMDLRTDVHLNEARAFDAEMSFWRAIVPQIGDGTIDDVVGGAS